MNIFNLNTIIIEKLVVIVIEKPVVVIVEKPIFVVVEKPHPFCETISVIVCCAAIFCALCFR